MSENNTIRISKATKELGIGLSTLHDFLKRKGFEVENNPNAKISQDMYELCTKEFSSDKKAKEQAEQMTIGSYQKTVEAVEMVKQTAAAKRVEEKTREIFSNPPPAPPVVAAQPVAPAPPAAVAALPVVAAQPIATAQPAAVAAPPVVAAQPVAPAPPIVDSQSVVAPPVVAAQTPAPAQPAAVAALPVAVAQPVAPAQPEGSVVILGKIDLSQIEPTKPINRDRDRDRDKNRRPIEPQKTAKPAAETPKPAPAKAAPAPIIAAPKPEIVEEETIRAKADKLQGTTVVGKIDLDQFKRKRPVASSSLEKEKESKRKRKTIGGTPETTSTTANTNNNRPNTGTGTYTNNRPNTGAGNNNRPNTGTGNNNRPNTGAGNNNRPNTGAGNRPNTGAGGYKKPATAQQRTEISGKDVQDQVKATLARLSQAGPKFANRQKLRRQKRDNVAQNLEEQEAFDIAQDKILKVSEFITTADLANLMDVPVSDVISTCFSLGLMVSINQRLDAETITIVADEFDFEVYFNKSEEQDYTLEEPDTEAQTTTRAPIVTIMGHVDHGKTSLIDYIRSANVIAGEAGGITQHIGAYEVTIPTGSQIAFIDTPGHEAFTAMRARGAKVTDIAIIVISADDSVMPQTKEAISHAQAAGVPMVFAINKMDKEGANPQRIYEQLAQMNILVESWGGKYQAQEISAKKGLNIDKLLEKIVLEAEILDLKADHKKRGMGTIIEASLDKGKGILATVLVQKGTLRVGDPILAGAFAGKVKALMNERGQRIKEAGPSQPVQVLGFVGAPTAGDIFYVTEDETTAREIATKRQQLIREQGIRTRKHLTIEEIGRRIAVGSFKELNLIIKGDVDGSVEALCDSMLKLSTPQIDVRIIHKGVGQISDSDVLLASTSDAIIIGFQVRALPTARKLAENEQIDIRYYSIIYDAINEIKSAMEGLLEPTIEEKIVCNVEVREVFKITKVGNIAGCMVLEGKINRNTAVRVVRDGVVVYTGELASLKRHKDDAKEVAAGYDCGLNIKNYNDIKIGDIVEGFERIEVKRKLS